MATGQPKAKKPKPKPFVLLATGRLRLGVRLYFVGGESGYTTRLSRASTFTAKEAAERAADQWRYDPAKLLTPVRLDECREEVRRRKAARQDALLPLVYE